MPYAELDGFLLSRAGAICLQGSGVETCAGNVHFPARYTLVTLHSWYVLTRGVGRVQAAACSTEQHTSAERKPVNNQHTCSKRCQCRGALSSLERPSALLTTFTSYSASSSDTCVLLVHIARANGLPNISQLYSRVAGNFGCITSRSVTHHVGLQPKPRLRR